jgi:hypothetical protein
MSRALLLAAAVCAGLLTGVGCAVFCADCNCPDASAVVEGTVTVADRDDLVGAHVRIDGFGLTVEYSRADGTAWNVNYEVPR